MDEQRFLSTREVARYLDVNEKMVYTLISEKRLPATKVTGKWIFPRDLVDRWIENHVVNYPEDSGPRAATGLVVFAGSNDLLLDKGLALFNREYPDHVAVFGNLGSMGGIRSLARGCCHVACSHLLQEDDQEYNFEFAQKELEGRIPAVVNFARREQGLVVAGNNPKGIYGVEDLGRTGISVVNRPRGTGTRLLFDRELARVGLDGSRIQGYEREFRGHMDVGLEVLAERADCAPAIRPVASALGLGFIPLRWERFDLLIRRNRFFDQGVQLFLGMLHEHVFQEIAARFEGYDLSMCGKMVYPRGETEQH
ncbi:MAG: substrate-binding domain-containing protein [Desulfatibacillaceae bacterium]